MFQTLHKSYEYQAGQGLSPWQGQAYFDKYLLIVAAIAGCLALVLYSVAGLQTAFWPLHKLSQNLPLSFWANVTFVGDTIAALTIVFLFTHKYPKLALAVLLSALVGTLIAHGFKHLFDTSRPPAIFTRDLLPVIGPELKRNSTPSGHTTTAFILAALLCRCVSSNIAKVAILLGATLIGYSRIACGVHWPVDVCMGAATGLVSTYFGLYFSDRIRLASAAYWLLSLILLGTAIHLFSYDGGFSQTRISAKILSVSTIIFWCFSWWQTIRSRPSNTSA